MSRTRWPLAALAIVALISAGCGSDAPSGTASGSSGADNTAASGNATTANHTKAMKFAECMRDNGVSEFPDPNASGELTIDAVANGSGLDTDSVAFKKAMSACRDLEPSGFTGHRRTAQQQEAALKFARCMRENGVPDFPDPTPDGALIDTTRIPSAAGRGARDIPGFQAATQKCHDLSAGALGRQR